jgi:hypothetical protein
VKKVDAEVRKRARNEIDKAVSSNQPGLPGLA